MWTEIGTSSHHCYDSPQLSWVRTSDITYQYLYRRNCHIIVTLLHCHNVTTSQWHSVTLSQWSLLSRNNEVLVVQLLGDMWQWFLPPLAYTILDCIIRVSPCKFIRRVLVCTTQVSDKCWEILLHSDKPLLDIKL